MSLDDTMHHNDPHLLRRSSSYFKRGMPLWEFLVRKLMLLVEWPRGEESISISQKDSISDVATDVVATGHPRSSGARR